MNAEGTKRLALIKSLVREQGADGDKCWLIVQLATEAQKNERLLAYVDGNDKDAELEAAEATCQSLRDQSSRWEAQALEAGVRIAELEMQIAEREAQVQRLRELAEMGEGALIVVLEENKKLRGKVKRYLGKARWWLAGCRLLDYSDKQRAILAESQEGKEG